MFGKNQMDLTESSAILKHNKRDPRFKRALHPGRGMPTSMDAAMPAVLAFPPPKREGSHINI